MIDLKKMRDTMEFLAFNDAHRADLEPCQVLDLLDMLDAAKLDAARLDFMIEQDAFLVWTERDGTILQCQLMTQDVEEDYHILSGEFRFFNTPREAIDAAMAATKGEQA